MGLVKGRFQSLKGLRQQIKDERDHCMAVEWIRTCLILHNLILDIENNSSTHDADFEVELIGIGLQGEMDHGNNMEYMEDGQQGARLSQGQKFRLCLQCELFDSGITSRDMT